MNLSAENSITEFRMLEDAESVAQAVAEYLFRRISQCVADNGICHVVLPGGTTPARCMELLADMPLPWQHIHWYPGDERCYPAGHEERNDVMIRRCLFSDSESIAENLHAIPAELGAEQAASVYARDIDTLGDIDIAVLGMGEDGHTASLFPGNPALQDTASIVPVHNAPKAPPDRVSFGLQALKNAKETILIATGSGKADAIAKFRRGEALPVSLLAPDICFTDKAAMAGLQPDAYRQT